MADLTNLMTWGTTAIVAIPFVVVALFLLLNAGRQRGAVNESKGWTQGSATIVSASVQARRGSNRGRSYYPYVVYEYDVNGQRYRNDRLYAGSEIGKGSAGWVQRDVERYAPGSQHPVYYDPADPRRAVLEQRAPATGFMGWAALLILLMVGCSVAFSLALGNFFGGRIPFMP